MASTELSETAEAAINAYVTAHERAFAAIELHNLAARHAATVEREAEPVGDDSDLSGLRRAVIGSEIAAAARRAAEADEKAAELALIEVTLNEGLDDRKVKELVPDTEPYWAALRVILGALADV